MTQTRSIKILARLNNGSFIVRTSWWGVVKMSEAEIDAHCVAGCAITPMSRR